MYCYFVTKRYKVFHLDLEQLCPMYIYICIGVNLVFSDVDMCSFEGYLQGTSVLKLSGKIRELCSIFHFVTIVLSSKNTNVNIVVFFCLIVTCLKLLLCDRVNSYIKNKLVTIRLI